jgi:dethiobiotin synthase
MAISFPERLFITGTDTGIGKTVISAILAVGLPAEYWKPVQSGTTDITDTEWVRQKTGLAATMFHEETYRLKQPLSPHASAAMEGIRIDLDAFRVPDIAPQSKHLIIEGAGGVMVPLNDQFLMLDLMGKIKAPVVVVTSGRLGTINHTLLSLAQLRHHGLEIFGVVINGPRNKINRNAIAHYGQVDILAEVEWLNTFNPKNLMSCFKKNFRG